ncbi:uncharacterized protein BCR38DRAFT_485311 [Pseudomassariella vexata]|uniref:Uncharacterized protein n=1 Tax=Pseudomassariella vexata TaxID=1141098 RepID=A0A1Y2DZX6_9PEZI|nr:uncharacterized protein BCR38DRAFT_485311 [Pseudomassariella vexata]ORY64175.1 hypothetical protein BCR38DRAFT_485311 [Pseudomassariella vexata]
MSYLRNLFGLGAAVGFGYWNATYALRPAFEEEQKKRQAREAEELALAAAKGSAANASNPIEQGPHPSHDPKGQQRLSNNTI